MTSALLGFQLEFLHGFSVPWCWHKHFSRQTHPANKDLLVGLGPWMPTSLFVSPEVIPVLIKSCAKEGRNCWFTDRKCTISITAILFILPLSIPKEIGFQKYARYLQLGGGLLLVSISRKGPTHTWWAFLMLPQLSLLATLAGPRILVFCLPDAAAAACLWLGGCLSSCVHPFLSTSTHKLAFSSAL